MLMRTKLVLAGLGVATVGATLGGIAMAADPTSNTIAPYAQAAATVGRDGSTTQRTETIESVSKIATGAYCVVLTPGINAYKSIPMATLSSTAHRGSEIRVSRNDAACPSNSIRVNTGKDGAAADQPFYLFIP
ncbi:hypothetical protein ACIGW7_23035 [Streptomyces sp. NPDC053253]|jgi:hypothetical protein|uniref:hypothetical protein n=1 Tax=Streptomyces sp. NPDC053253 TaxID=3365699 RepID=UPI0037D3B984